jgi:DNA-binding beta-propeller fold protein YncE
MAILHLQLRLTSCLATLTGVVLAAAAVTLSGHAQAQSTSPAFLAFESGHVRPMAKSADGTRLFVVNTPNNTLEIFNIQSTQPQLLATVPVGLEPVSVAVRADNEVWVVNHLSDSLSVVSLDGVPRVVRTLLVGDEPRDIVFAGSPAKAFITTAHRGQHRVDPSIASVPGAGDPQLKTPSVNRADVWVFNPAQLGSAMGGVPVRIMSFFADTPRALAVSPDGNTVYVAAFKSGNQTSVSSVETVCDGFNPKMSCLVSGSIYPGGLPGPSTNAEGKPAPETGLIVKYNATTQRWEDSLARNWNNAVKFTLPDKDVFAVDANQLTEKVAFRGVGTTLFNMVTNPVTGALYVTNTEANNAVRFEGPGVFGGSTVQGKLALSRITVITNGLVTPRHLNKHIDYSKLANSPGFDPSAKNHSLATPLGMAVSRDGRTMYVAAYGSSRVGVFSTSELESNTFDPRSASAGYINVRGGGPSGLLLDETRRLMYVTTRFDNALKVIDLSTKAEVASATMYNPEPAHIVQGRPFLYDAMRSSANGEASCASCHIFADEDALAWDLGNPDDKVTSSPLLGKFTNKVQFPVAKLIFGVQSKINGSDNPFEFHPMKGPMTTQTLKGMRNSGAMHWRGDRSNGEFGISATDSNLSFINFVVAFQGLLGNAQALSREEMQKFADFQLNVMLPPNPVRNLDNSLNAAQQRGFNFYTGTRQVDGIRIDSLKLNVGQNCNGCHALDASKGQYGASGEMSFEGVPQTVKIAHLRNMYQKVGMFGAPTVPFFKISGTGKMGDQIRGFGFTHDGAVDTLFRFFNARVFQNTGNTGFPSGTEGDKVRRDIEDYMMAFDNDIAPIVGQQITLTASNTAAVAPRINLLIQRAQASFVSKELGGLAKECDLVATVVESGVRRGYFYDVGGALFVGKDGRTRNDAQVRALASASGQEVTYTCTPPGSGRRVAFASF